MEQYIHSIKSSRTCNIITVVVGLLVAVMFGRGIYMLTQYTAPVITIVSLTLVVLLFGICTIALMAIKPRTIEVNPTHVIIHRVSGQVSIDRSDIIKVCRKKKIWRDLRTWGSGGYIGFIGHYYSFKEGQYYAYVLDEQSMVYIKTRGRCYVVSCEDPDKLIEELS